MANQFTLYKKISIVVVLTILTVLIIKPLELLDTSDNGSIEQNPVDNIKHSKIELDYHQLRRCASNYKYWIAATYFCNYDRNCTYSGGNNNEKTNNSSISNIINITQTQKINVINYSIGHEIRIMKPKSVQVTGCILSLMLVVLIISASIEYLRNRFNKIQDSSMKVGNSGCRRSPIVDLVLPQRCNILKPIRTQMSLDIRGFQRTSYRAMGTRSSSLVRRSSFPIYFNPDVGANDLPTPPRSPRRQSNNCENEAISGFTRHAHLIRRH